MQGLFNTAHHAPGGMAALTFDEQRARFLRQVTYEGPGADLGLGNELHRQGRLECPDVYP